MDNIKLEKIWQDDDFFEVLVICENEIITVSTEVYVTEYKIDELQKEISKLLEYEETVVFWSSGKRGNDSTPCVEFKFSMKKNTGHILIECFMELNDGGNLDSHNCCFFVNSEFGMLYNFSSNLNVLKEPKLGVCVSING